MGTTDYPQWEIGKRKAERGGFSVLRCFGASVTGFFIIGNKFVSSLCMGPQNLCDPAQAERFVKIVGAAWGKEKAERRIDEIGGRKR